jgi:hypothetical protein
MRSDDELERALAEDSIQPSSGFTASVMAKVRLAATEPPPLRFPWGRFALGLVSCAIFAGAATALTTEAATAWIVVATTLSPLTPAAPQLVYATLGLALSLALSRLPRLFIRS